MAVIIPSGTNQAKNPSYETNLNGFTTSTNGTQARSSATSWVGSWAARVTVTSTSGSVVHTNLGLSTNAYRTLCNPGDTVNLKCRVLSSSNVRSHQVAVIFIDASNLGIGSTFLGAATATNNLQYTEVSFTDAVAPAGAVAFGYDIRYTAPAAVNDWFDVDGWEVRVNESLDTYIDGDQGSLYSWLGTAHNSASVRAQAFGPAAVGTGGFVQMIPSLFRATNDNQILDDLSDDLIDATVTFTADGDVHLQFSATMRNPDQLTPYFDYLAPFLELQYADGTSVKHQVGLFIVIPGPVTYTPTSSIGTVVGRSEEWLLAIDEFSGSYHVSAGVDYTAAVTTILLDNNIPHFSVPIAGKTLPTTKTWPAGTSKLAIINDLLQGVNYYPLHADRHGRVRSFLRTDLSQRGSDASFVGDPIVGNVESSVTVTPDTGKFANQVIVSLNDPNNDPIFVKLQNNNLSSPVSIPRLGFRKTLRLSPSTLPDSTTALQLAHSALEDASLRHVAIQLGIVPDPSRQPFEVYTVTLNQEDGTSIAAGKYYGTSWTLGFRPAQGAMNMTLNRVEVYQ